jgi:hypothetical protein
MVHYTQDKSFVEKVNPLTLFTLIETEGGKTACQCRAQESMTKDYAKKYMAHP